MDRAVVTGAVIIAIVAAVRSTWSPCGWSMLSTVTPLSERARRRRYGVTACWFVIGATAGGLGLGSIGAVLAQLPRALGLSVPASVAAATLVLAAAAAIDLGVLGPPLPHHRRQVNEDWLDHYRGWVYGVGFGVQIGFGLATYIMSASVYATILLGALTGRSLSALGIGALFGFVRGLMILLGAASTTPERLVVFHRRFERATEPVRVGVVTIELSLGLAGASLLGWVWGAVFLAFVAVAAAAPGRRRPAVRQRPDLRAPADGRRST